MAFINVQSNEDLDKAEAERIAREKQAEAGPQPLNYSLMGLLRNRWDTAVRAKRATVEDRWFKNMDLAASIYEAAKLAAIREMGGSEVFIGIADSKCRSGKAWMRDALFQPGKKPWGVEPTPVPEMPKEIIEGVTQQFISDTLRNVTQSASMQGIVPDMNVAVGAIQDALPDLRNRIEAELKNIAWDKARLMEKELDDKLVEGGWYDALDECQPDFVVLGNCVMLGPFKRKKAVLAAGPDGGVVVQDRVVDEYQYTSVFNVYPQPDSSGPQDGWVIVKLSYRKMDLQELIGVPGFNDEEIRIILSEADRGTFREWTQIETERAQREKKDTAAVYDTDAIDCLLYMGPVSGRQLQEAGVENIPEDKLDFEFPANVWFIGNHYIKAVINEDPLKRQPIHRAQFEENVNGWWSRGLPELIDAEVQICNACARAISNNVAMASGPQVEVNTDRLRGGDKGDTRLVPWKRWLTTNRQQQTGPAIQFWQPQMHAGEILQVFNDFRKGADDRSGIPGYAHGDSQIGGAGNTASGLSMLITQAARGIRGTIKNMDRNLIASSVNILYEQLALDPRYKEKIGDVRLVAKGSAILVEKEQRAIRMLEFLNATNNPVDTTLMGVEGRGYLLSEVAKTYEIDPERALPKLAEFKGKSMQEVMPPPEGAVPTGGQPVPNRGTPPVAARNMAPGGMEPQGGAAQLFGGRGGPATAPEGAEGA